MPTYLVIPDTHSYNFDPKAWGTMIDYVVHTTLPVDEIIFLGDLVEGDSISTHNIGKPGLTEGLRLQDDFQFAQQLISNISQAADCSNITLLKGNHEYRVDRFVETQPALKNLLTVEKGLAVRTRGIHVVSCYPEGAVYRKGKLTFTHGVYTGANAGMRHLNAFGGNICFGHTHSVSVTTKTTFSKSHAQAAYNLGCLCKLDMPYLAGSPNNWQHAFGVVHMAKSGAFSFEVKMITDGKLYERGEVYTYAKVPLELAPPRWKARC